MDANLAEQGSKLSEDLAEFLSTLSDKEIGDLFGTGVLDKLLNSILDPSTVQNYPNFGDFFLANKWRSTYVAMLHYAITHNYSFQGKSIDGKPRFVSPSVNQWIDNGVMLLEGSKPFTGVLSLYRDNTPSYGILKRDIPPGGEVGVEDVEFIDLETLIKRKNQIPLDQIKQLDEPVQKLEALLIQQDNDESKYQELFRDYPWVFGARYTTIQRHTRLDDTNIPDFTGVRVHDNCRDIIELKPPFLKLFRADGKFADDFNQAWNQAERYLSFTHRSADHLIRERGLRFENPVCRLILGFNLTPEQTKRIRDKQSMNPLIEVLTYNDLLALMKDTIRLVRQLKEADSETLQGPREEDRPVAVEISENMLRVSLQDGRVIATPLEWYPRLVEASPAQQANVELNLTGIHWPDLDEDLSVQGMLKGNKPSLPQPRRKEQAEV